MAFDEPIYRPPWEAGSLLVSVTQSCNWNRCKFCYRSKDYPFRIADLDTSKQEILMQKPFYPTNTRVFFVGSNNFALPTHRLLDFLDAVNELLPDHGRVAMFSRVDAIERKSDEELAELAARGCGHLYVGTENGNDEALELMDKGHTTAEAVRQLHRLDAAGITYTVFYILGLGGNGAGQKSARETAALFNQVHPERIVTTGMTVTEGTGAWDMQMTGDYVQASEREKIEELRTFLQGLTVDTFYDGLHALNPLHYRFRTADEEKKATVLADIDRVLTSFTDEEIELAVNRPAMAEASKAENAR